MPNLMAQLGAMERQEALLQARIQSAVAALRRLRDAKRILLGKLNRAVNRIEKIAGMNVPAQVVKEIEAQINNEGWMERIIAARFKSSAEHGPGSRKWRPLTRRYLRQKIAAGFPGKILVRTGDLFASASDAVAGTFSLRSKINFEGKIEAIDLPYAARMNYGFDSTPARPFMSNPNKKELEPTMKRARAILRAKLRQLARAS